MAEPETKVMRESEKYPVGVLVGQRDTGKTTFMKGDTKLNIPGYVKQKMAEVKLKGVIIVDTMRARESYLEVKKIDHPQQYKSGAVHLIVNAKNAEEMVQWIVDNVTDTFILLEDAVKVVPDRIKGTAYDALIVDSKNIRCPFWSMWHTWMDVPKGFYSKMDLIEIFKIKQHPSVRRNDITNYEEVLEVYKKVQKNKSPFYHESVSNGA